MLKYRMRRREFDHEEAVEKLEPERGHGKEIHGGNRLAMVGEEGPQLLPESSPCRLSARKYLAIVRSDTSKPSFCSSP